ncbi:MAG TPA: peptidylprolyl isomerase [Dehalococcoidia bacterium]|nr:peptidylprolyl isomerase [Dehalococcoidia bacterium]
MLQRFLIAVAAIGLLVVACGDDDDDDSDTPQEEEAAEDGDDGGDPCPGEDQEGDGDEAASGDTVRIEYCGTLDDGSQFDSSLEEGRDPLEFTLGAGEVVPGFDEAVTGMRVGERKTVTIPADQAYGEPDPERIQEVSIEQFGGEVPEVGSQVQASNGATGTILEVTDTTVTVDFNHPLAGEDLTFEIELVEIV